MTDTIILTERDEIVPVVSTIMAIDPGNVESAYVVIDADTRCPVDFAKIPNHNLIQDIRHNLVGRLAADCSVIEMVASYGMPVGREVFDTCVWVGRFHEAIFTRTSTRPELVYRHPVKLHHCGSARAKDANIIQALVDRFAPGQPNKGKGTKADPGWFHGFAADVWQAYALAVYVADVEGTTARTGPPAVVIANG